MPTTNINLENSQTGIINTGSLHEIESIDVTISNLKSRGGDEIAHAFKELVEAVAANNEFSNETDREELLQKIDVLANQAAIDREHRKLGVIKMTLAAAAGTCSSVGGLAAVWSTWGPQIEAFLLS